MSINSSAVADTVETQVFRRFHADFVTLPPHLCWRGTHARRNNYGQWFCRCLQATGTNIVPNGTATVTQQLDTPVTLMIRSSIKVWAVESIYRRTR